MSYVSKATFGGGCGLLIFSSAANVLEAEQIPAEAVKLLRINAETALLSCFPVGDGHELATKLLSMHTDDFRRFNRYTELLLGKNA